MPITMIIGKIEYQDDEYESRLLKFHKSKTRLGYLKEGGSNKSINNNKQERNI